MMAGMVIASVKLPLPGVVRWKLPDVVSTALDPLVLEA